MEEIVEKIMGATTEFPEDVGSLYFLVKLRDPVMRQWMPAREANVKIPQIVIKFYEERLFWYDKEDSTNVGEANTHEIVPSSEQ